MLDGLFETWDYDGSNSLTLEARAGSNRQEQTERVDWFDGSQPSGSLDLVGLVEPSSRGFEDSSVSKYLTC